MPFFYRKNNTVLQKPPFSDSGLCRAVSKKLKAQAAVLLPAPDFAMVEVSDVPLKSISSARGNRFYIYSSMVPPAEYFVDLLLLLHYRFRKSFR